MARMHKVEMDVDWVFRLKGHEARLILSALGGRLRPEQREEAKRLGDELTVLRANWAGQLAEEMDKHADKVEMAG
jgi:hypothetical protein